MEDTTYNYMFKMYKDYIIHPNKDNGLQVYILNMEKRIWGRLHIQSRQRTEQVLFGFLKRAVENSSDKTLFAAIKMIRENYQNSDIMNKILNVLVSKNSLVLVLIDAINNNTDPNTVKANFSREYRGNSWKMTNQVKRLIKEYNFDYLKDYIKKAPEKWYKGCTNQEDPIMFSSFEELERDDEMNDPIMLYIPAINNQRKRVLCMSREDFRNIANDAPMLVEWVPHSPDTIVDSDGHGLGPRKHPEFYFKQLRVQIPIALNMKSILEIAYGNLMEYYLKPLTKHEIRYGNKAGTFGVSDAHGQNHTLVFEIDPEGWLFTE